MEQLAQIVDRVLVPQTASQPRSIVQPALVAPTTDAECRALAEWARTTPVERQPRATPKEIAARLAFMRAALPSEKVGDEAGDMKAIVYATLLAEFSNEALAYMARQACATLDWFPTPKQCIDLARQYRAPVPPQETALRQCADYTERQFDRWQENVRAGQPIGDVPESWCLIAVERGVLRRLEDRSFVARAHYQGPTKPWSAVLDTLNTEKAA